MSDVHKAVTALQADLGATKAQMSSQQAAMLARVDAMEESMQKVIGTLGAKLDVLVNARRRPRLDEQGRPMRPSRTASRKQATPVPNANGSTVAAEVALCHDAHAPGTDCGCSSAQLCAASGPGIVAPDVVMRARAVEREEIRGEVVASGAIGGPYSTSHPLDA